MRGSNLIPNACVIPHHHNFGKAWADQLMKLLPNATLIGIDERTGMINDPSGTWQVYGAGNVTMCRDKQIAIHTQDETFTFYSPKP